MSQPHFIKQLFEIEDENLGISQELIEEEKQGVCAHILPAKLCSIHQKISDMT